jgi:hypothetical protein
MSKLYVRIYGLDRDVAPEERISIVKAIFAPHIELADDQVQLITDREYGGYRNFCFVMCEEADVARLSEALDQTTTEDGYELTVNEARPMEDRKPMGRNDRGGSRGGFSRGGDRGGDRAPRRDY